MQLDVGGTGINLKEILVSKYLRVDKVIRENLLTSAKIFSIILIF